MRSFERTKPRTRRRRRFAIENGFATAPDQAVWVFGQTAHLSTTELTSSSSCWGLPCSDTGSDGGGRSRLSARSTFSD